MNSLAGSFRPSPLAVRSAPLIASEVLDARAPTEAVALSADEQLLVVAAVFRPVMRLVAAAYALPRVSQAQFTEGRQVAERARDAHLRFDATLRAVAEMRDGAQQGDAMTRAIDQAGSDLAELIAFAKRIEARSPGAIQRVLDYTDRFVAERRKESAALARKRNPLSQWDYVTGQWSTRGAIVLQRHALPMIDGELDGFLPRLAPVECDD